MPAKLKTRREVRVREQLNNVGLKATTQRLEVLRVLHSNERQHMSAEDVYHSIIEANGRVGLATVYRVLGQLVDVGILARHIFDAESGKAVYSLHQGKHQDHLICLQCGRVDQFADDIIANHSRGVAESNGYALSQHQLALYGYCARCRAASKGAAS